MTTRLAIDIKVTPTATLVKPYSHPDFKSRRYPRVLSWDGVLIQYVADHGYRLKSYTEVTTAGYKRHYYAEVEVLSPNSGGVKKVKKNIKKSVDIFQEI